MTIHDVSSVPLVHGEFGVKWKFKNVQHQSNRLFGLRKPSYGKGKESDYASSTSGSQTPDQTPDNASSIDQLSVGSSSAGPSTLPSVVVSSHGHTSSVDSRSNSSQSLGAPSLTHSNSLPSSSGSTPMSSSTNTASSSDVQSSDLNADAEASARGLTAFRRLREHRVNWEHNVEAVVKMDVERATSELLPFELKLVVMQRVIPGDPDAPHNPRLGALYLNLAEYADAGPITRRYLLRESKTNAVLKLSIHVSQIDTDKTIYKAPPLPKGEILTGVAQLLEDEIHRVRPISLGLYEGFPTADDPHVNRPSLFRKKSSSLANQQLPKYDLERLPFASGPKTTHDIIDAIFNPVPTVSTKEVTPFTYLVAPTEFKAAKEDWVKRHRTSSEEAAEEEKERVMRRSEDGGGVSTNGGHGHGVENGAAKARWWSLNSRSRPGTPQPVR